MNSVISLKMQKGTKTWEGSTFRSSSHFFGFSFRERNFSLKIRRIRPSAGFGARRRNVLRGAGYAWTPDLRVLTNSLRYDFLPTCVLFPFLRVFRCFGWFEAVRGRLIGPKTWDRTCGIFLGFSWMAVTAQKFRGAVWVFKS